MHVTHPLKKNTLKLNILPSLLIILTSLSLFFYTQHKEQQQLTQLLEKESNRVSEHIQMQLQAYINQSLQFRQRNLYTKNISQKVFNQFAQYLIQYNPEIHNVEWGVLISATARHAFEQELQQLYGTKIIIKEFNSEGNVQTSPAKEEYLPVKYVYPLANNQAVLGLEADTDFADFNALRIARKTGQVMIKGPIIPIQLSSEKNNISIISYLPFYQPNNQSQKQFTAYLSLVINIQAFIQRIVSQNHFEQMYIKISDVTTEISQDIYSNVPPEIEKKFHDYHQAQEIILANKVWSISLYPSLVFIKQQSLSAYWILFLGLLASLITFISGRLSQRKQLTLQQQLEDLATGSNTTSNLLSAIFETQQAILLTDINAKILKVNDAFTKITGYAEHEVLGKNPRLLSSGRQSPDFYKAMWRELLNSGNFESEIWNRHKNGSVFLEQQMITAVKDARDNITHFISIFSDITKKKQEEEKIKHLAFYDPLTLLPNRRLLLDRLEQALQQAQRAKTSGALLSIDIDNFKAINDQFGHHQGDELLIYFAKRISQLLRLSDTIARIDGDQFVIILPTEKTFHTDVIAHATHVINKILLCSKQAFLLNDQDYCIFISMGVTLLDYENYKATDLLRQADVALYKAKAKGNHGFCFYQD